MDLPQTIRRAPLWALAKRASQLHSVARLSVAVALMIASGVLRPVLARMVAANSATSLVTAMAAPKYSRRRPAFSIASLWEIAAGRTRTSARVIVEIITCSSIPATACLAWAWCLSTGRNRAITTEESKTIPAMNSYALELNQSRQTCHQTLQSIHRELEFYRTLKAG